MEDVTKVTLRVNCVCTSSSLELAWCSVQLNTQHPHESSSGGSLSTDHRIHRAIGYLVHVLPGCHHEVCELQLPVLCHALEQQLLEAGSPCTRGGGGIELEVDPTAAAQLQHQQLPRGACELLQFAEELLPLA